MYACVDSRLFNADVQRQQAGRAGGGSFLRSSVWMTSDKLGPELPPLSLTQLPHHAQNESDLERYCQQPQKNTKLSIVEVLAERSEDGKWEKLHSEVSSRKGLFFFPFSFLLARVNR